MGTTDVPAGSASLDVRRMVPFEQTRANRDGQTLEGYAAVFDVPTLIDSWEGRFAERLRKGAFAKTIRDGSPVLQFDHGSHPLIGSIPLGRIQTLKEDDDGLFVRARLSDNWLVEPIRDAIRDGAINGMSFRFRVIQDEFDRDAEWAQVYGDDVPGRTLIEVAMPELGPVVFPAYEETQVGVRSDELPEGVKAGAVDLRNVLAVRMEARLADGSQEGVQRDADVPMEAQRDAADVPQDDPQDTEETGEVDSEEAPAPPQPGTEDVGTPDDAAADGTPDEAASTTDEPPARHSTDSQQDQDNEDRSPDMDLPTAAERIARQGEIRSRLAEIDADHSGAALPPQIAEEWQRLSQEYDDNVVAIREDNARKERLRAIAAAEDGDEGDAPAPTRNAGGRGGRVALEAGGIAAPQGRRQVTFDGPEYDLTEIRKRARSVDELPELYRDNAMRALEQTRFVGVAREAAQENVERLLETVDDAEGTLARRLLVTGSPVYQRAFGKAVSRLSTDGLTSEEKRALSLGVDPAGGYAVPFALDPTVVLTSDGRINPLRQIARVEQIVGKEWQGVTTEGITVSRADEAQEADDNSPEFAQPTVRPSRVQGFVPFSIEIDQDWNAMQAEITRLLADAKEQEEATSFVHGDGTGNQPGGLLGTMPESSQVAAEGGGISSEHLYALEESLGPRWRAFARFVGNKAQYNRVRQLDTAGGADLWERIGAGMPSELLGYPAHEMSTMVDSAGEGDAYLVFGDFSQFLIVDRVGMSVELVPHLFGENRRPTGQRGLYAMWRNGSLIIVPSAFRVLTGTAAGGAG